MIIDAHQHFWDPATADYPWMAAPELAPLQRKFGPDDLAPLLAANGVDKTILVQCRSSIEETEAFLRIAHRTPFVAGVVGWIDLASPDAGRTIDRLRTLPGGDRLVGIRHQVHDEPDPDWLTRDDVRRGLEAVFDRGLAYDLLVRTRELPAAIQVARAFPHGRFVLDHAAKPPIARLQKGGFDKQWAERLVELAACPNVWCKISGLATEANWNDWDADTLWPSIHHAWRCFGEDRLIWGSDWPVCLLAGSYERVKGAAEVCFAKLGLDVRRKAFGVNAQTAYGAA